MRRCFGGLLKSFWTMHSSTRRRPVRYACRSKKTRIMPALRCRILAWGSREKIKAKFSNDFTESTKLAAALKGERVWDSRLLSGLFRNIMGRLRSRAGQAKDR